MGQQVRRMLPEGRPVMVQSVMAPLVIDQGERVRIRFDDGAIVLTAPGRALNDAASGDTVRVVNLVSNVSLVGTAQADGTVEILDKEWVGDFQSSYDTRSLAIVNDGIVKRNKRIEVDRTVPGTNERQAQPCRDDNAGITDVNSVGTMRGAAIKSLEVRQRHP